MASYVDQTVQELAVCYQKLKDVLNVVDSVLSDYENVPQLRKLCDRKEMTNVGVNVSKAMSTIAVVLRDAETEVKY